MTNPHGSLKERSHLPATIPACPRTDPRTAPRRATCGRGTCAGSDALWRPRPPWSSRRAYWPGARRWRRRTHQACPRSDPSCPLAPPSSPPSPPGARTSSAPSSSRGPRCGPTSSTSRGRCRSGARCRYSSPCTAVSGRAASSSRTRASTVWPSPTTISWSTRTGRPSAASAEPAGLERRGLLLGRRPGSGQRQRRRLHLGPHRQARRPIPHRQEPRVRHGALQRGHPGRAARMPALWSDRSHRG